MVERSHKNHNVDRSIDCTVLGIKQCLLAEKLPKNCFDRKFARFSCLKRMATSYNKLLNEDLSRLDNVLGNSILSIIQVFFFDHLSFVLYVLLIIAILISSLSTLHILSNIQTISTLFQSNLYPSEDIKYILDNGKNTPKSVARDTVTVSAVIDVSSRHCLFSMIIFQIYNRNHRYWSQSIQAFW